MFSGIFRIHCEISKIKYFCSIGGIRKTYRLLFRGTAMTIHQIRYILTIAEYGSLSEAAQRLFISQPSLSQQVRNLETELGYSIFRRTPQGVVLTKDGELFCSQAESVIDCWDDFEQSVSQSEKHPQHQLRLGMGSRVSSNHLFNDIICFFDQHPEWEITIITEAGQDYLSSLRSGTMDLALDRLPPSDIAAMKDDIFSCDLIRERQCILMSPDDDRKKLPGITFSQLNGCSMMTGLENSIEDRTLRSICKRHNIPINRLYRSDSIETVMALVRSGKGIVIGPESFAAYYRVAAVPLIPETDECLKFICLKKNSTRKDLVSFRCFLQALCKDRTSDQNNRIPC